MLSSSTSVPDGPLPFGADDTSQTAWRRSHSAPRSTNHNAQGINELYRNTAEPSTYPAFIAAVQASDVASRRASASIAPSSINDLPHRIKKLVKRHRTQLLILAIMFQLHIIALTIGITLGATSAHSHGEGGTQVAAIILGITGFVGVVSSVALGWLTWKGRQARARLEKKWVDEEEMKETRSLREKDREHTARHNSGERERSLTRNRSVSRGRRRDSAWVLPSFKDMTPSPPPEGSGEANANLPPNLEKGKERIPEMRTKLMTIYSANVVAQAEPEVGNGEEGESNYTHYLSLDDSSEEEVPPGPAIDKGKQRDNADKPHVPELPPSAPEANTQDGIQQTQQQLEQEIHDQISRFNAFHPLEKSSDTVLESNAMLLNDSQTDEPTTSTILGSSPTLLNNTPISSPNTATTDQEISNLNSTLINSFRPINSPINITPREAQSQFPTPYHHQSHFPTPFPSPKAGGTTPTTQLGFALQSSGQRPESIQRAEYIIRLGNGNRGSLQNDENFMTMIDNEGSESGDEDVRQYRREKSRERVGAWAAGQMDLDDGGEGRSRRERGRGDSEERGKGWRGRLRLARGISRDGRDRGDEEKC